MSDGVITLACGIALVISGQWYVPREMRRIRARLVSRGRDPSRFDAAIGAPWFRAAIVLVTVAGVMAAVLGVVELAGG